ncbi:MFS transporter [Novosphingobium piscinae]|uniref:MFS transporter n=1 Tax=Novosphingobium piscinae TaxID=1507448 RepID=A0A7X1FZV5_9SPHN|nr:MFS transporter [Novosphingobium piscinae]MBC2670006.1 MFS transporter [Novosphingobium piscinae]
MADLRDRTEPAAAFAAPTPVGTFAPLRYPAFRAIWTANLLSQLGSMIQSIAAAWLMTELTRSHTLIAAIQASATAPILLVGVFAGAIADNYDRRRVMLAAQSAMLLCSAALAAFSATGLLGPYGLIAFTLAVGTGTALNAPAWQASVRAQVGPRDLPQAIALNTVALNLARSIGPALGGVLVATIGVTAAFGLNAVSYLALIFVLLRWRPGLPAPARRAILPSIRVGLAFCAGSGPVRRILLRGLCVGIGGSALQSLLPAVIRDNLAADETLFGLLLAAFGLGSILGALVVTRLRRSIGAEAVVRVGAVIYAASMLALALIAQAAVLFPFIVLGGVAFTFCFTTINVAMQLRSPEAILGRCMAIYQSVSFGGMAIGAGLWGWLADLTSSAVALGLAAAFLLAATVLLGLVAPLPRPGEGVVLAR